MAMSLKLPRSSQKLRQSPGTIFRDGRPHGAARVARDDFGGGGVSPSGPSPFLAVGCR
jgi:hypothetical protein